MDFPLIDRSNYLKGLLITARKDKQLTDTETAMIKKLASRLGFSSDFFEETISNLLENKYITEEPIKFSNQEIAKFFIEDGLKLALSDGHDNVEEINWLKEIAKENDIREEWVNKKLEELKDKPSLISKFDFALFSII